MRVTSTSEHISTCFKLIYMMWNPVCCCFLPFAVVVVVAISIAMASSNRVASQRASSNKSHFVCCRRCKEVQFCLRDHSGACLRANPHPLLASQFKDTAGFPLGAESELEEVEVEAEKLFVCSLDCLPLACCLVCLLNISIHLNWPARATIGRSEAGSQCKQLRNQ